MNALEAAEAAVRHLKSAMEGVPAGPGGGWQVRGDLNEAVRHLTIALDLCRSAQLVVYHVERDADGNPLRMWWGGPPEEEQI